MLPPPQEVAIGGSSGGRGVWGMAKMLSKVVLATLLLLGMVAVILMTDRSETVSQERGSLPSYLKYDVSTTITIVRAIQGVLTALVGMTVSQSFSYLQWGFLRSSRDGGAPYLRQLALSPTTSVSGTLHLVFHRASGWEPRFWGLLRVFLVALVGLSGVVLLFRTEIVVVYDTGHTYPVSAGIGPFNASLVEPFMQRLKALAPSYKYSTLPYSYYGVVQDLVINPFYSTAAQPLYCEARSHQDGADDCAAYLFSGGTVLSTPWIPSGFPDHPQVLMDNVSMIHAEFFPVAAEKHFDNSAECRLFGSNSTKIAVKFCLSQSSPTTLDAGIFLCKGGIPNGVCKTTTDPTPNITTSFSFSQRSGTVLSAKANYTIISTTKLTAPIPLPFTASDISAYNTVLSWLLDYSAANIPAPSSIIETFWSSESQMSHSFASALLRRNFRSILVFPLWLFNDNNYGNGRTNTNSDGSVLAKGLPSEHYTTASLVQPLTKIKFNRALVATFIGFQGVAILFAWVVLAWTVAVRRSLPEISSYPLFDAEFKAEARGEKVPDARKLWVYRDREILDAMGDAKVERRVV